MSSRLLVVTLPGGAGKECLQASLIGSMKPSNPMKYTPEGRTIIFMSSGREFVVIDDFSQLTEKWHSLLEGTSLLEG